MINPFSRRVLLRGFGTTLCLPFLETFGPAKALAASQTVEAPRRLIFLSYAWGAARKDWFPTETGKGYKLSKSLEPLQGHYDDFSVLSNLSNKNSSQGHWGCTTWLTSADVTATQGKQFQNTVSVDQVAARKLGVETRYRSLELSGGKEDGTGPGLSLSWSEAGNEIAGETSPSALFDRLFGAAEVPLEERKYLLSKEQSVLDAVLEDAKSIRPQLSGADRDKVDEYFQSVRDIETRLTKAEEWLDKPKPPAPFDRPNDKMDAVEEISIMFELMAAAIQTDMSRVFTYRMPVQRLIDSLGFKIKGHATTHCTTESKAYEASVAQDRKKAELVAKLIDRLKEMKDPDGSTVFSNTLIAYGSNIRYNHDQRDVPTLVAGHGGGKLNHGCHHVYESKQTALADLWLGMLHQVGVKEERFADSNGVLPGLFNS